MSKHTPGPWDLHHQSPDFLAGDCDWSLQTEEAGAFLLFAHDPRLPKETQEANSHLVGAAYDLLEALRVIAEMPIEDFGYQRRADDYPIYGCNGHQLTVGHVRAARAAIAKAEGQS